MRFIELTELNRMMTGSTQAMQEADAVFLHGLQKIATRIAQQAAQCPIVLLAGPSGSGKTTTAYLLERFLDRCGVESHTISMDHFFRTQTPEQQKLAAKGKLDLESPDRMDVPYLNQQLEKIIAGEPTWMPKYHFSTATREDKDWLLQRKPQELLILEGIHALNPSVITIPDCYTVRMYVSVRTRIIHQGITLHPSKMRLLRRMLRDRKFRQRDFSETIAMFSHVQTGEYKYIAPYKSRSTYSVDTFFPYELGVYRTLLENELDGLWEYPMLKELQHIWDAVTPLSIEQVPKDSLIREFIGESAFCY